MKSIDDFSDLPLSSRDLASLILCSGSGDDLNDQSQLLAIREVLVRNRKAEIGLGAEIERLRARAKRTGDEQAIDNLHYLFDVSTYQDAAHSMVAASLLAPFIEGVLSRAVHGVEYLRGTGNCSRIDWRTIKERITKVGIKPYMPSDFDQVVDALFLYRNKVLHCGLEWPRDDRNEFNSWLNKWPNDWFSMAKSNSVPVIFWMTPTFVKRCFVLADQIIDGVIEFEDNNRVLFAQVIDAPPEWLQAYLEATKD